MTRWVTTGTAWLTPGSFLSSDACLVDERKGNGNVRSERAEGVTKGTVQALLRQPTLHSFGSAENLGRKRACLLVALVGLTEPALQ